MPVLIIAEHDNQSIKSATLHAVTAAARCGDTLHLLVCGDQCGTAAQAAAAIAGIAQVLVADAPHFGHGLAENLAAQVLAIGPGYSHIVATATAAGKNVLPRVAAGLDVAQVSEITNVLAADTFERPIYAGNVVATVRSSDAIKVVSVRATAFEAAAADGGSAEIVTLEAVADSGLSRFVSRQTTSSDRPELASARIVVSGGRGLGSGEHYAQLLEPLADRLHAALGASRAAVDAGYVPNDYQIGQTGKVVAPDLYIAVGISGAIQHLAGMKDSKVIVALNKDADAPIFSVADYGIVGDLFELVPQLVEQLG
ncbi:electron transfer flavoprotein subunit alpha/FixB family protein [Herbaspirillum sp. YR522]|uniref:electron transfer flavoprotein subunit alpha/FixB family protein n=1 Tax=Herbaspirillum sp. YR522 TaxID=1144342 RepID=UPI00026FB3CD|nr:FAD-binding protein [Herbaspirillum sp. YR522]EJN00323.1 electron transfer flavoprotein, alpha subunit [Herbaspirillum sp. YR522]